MDLETLAKDTGRTQSKSRESQPKTTVHFSPLLAQGRQEDHENAKYGMVVEPVT